MNSTNYLSDINRKSVEPNQISQQAASIQNGLRKIRVIQRSEMRDELWSCYRRLYPERLKQSQIPEKISKQKGSIYSCPIINGQIQRNSKIPDLPIDNETADALTIFLNTHEWRMSRENESNDGWSQRTIRYSLK